MTTHSTFILTLLILLCCGTAYAAQHEKTDVPAPAQDARCSGIERKNYEALSPPLGPYSHAVKHGNVLYLSGLTAYGTAAQGKSMAEQARAVFEQIKTIAQAEGTGTQSIIKVTLFITDFSQAQELRKELFRQYGEHIPASSMIEVAKLFSPDVNIEIEAILGL